MSPTRAQLFSRLGVITIVILVALLIHRFFVESLLILLALIVVIYIVVICYGIARLLRWIFNNIILMRKYSTGVLASHDLDIHVSICSRPDSIGGTISDNRYYKKWGFTAKEIPGSQLWFAGGLHGFPKQRAIESRSTVIDIVRSCVKKVMVNDSDWLGFVAEINNLSWWIDVEEQTTFSICPLDCSFLISDSFHSGGKRVVEKFEIKAKILPKCTITPSFNKNPKFHWDLEMQTAVARSPDCPWENQVNKAIVVKPLNFSGSLNECFANVLCRNLLFLVNSLGVVSGNSGVLRVRPKGSAVSRPESLEESKLDWLDIFLRNGFFIDNDAGDVFWASAVNWFHGDTIACAGAFLDGEHVECYPELLHIRDVFYRDEKCVFSTDSGKLIEVDNDNSWAYQEGMLSPVLRGLGISVDECDSNIDVKESNRILRSESEKLLIKNDLLLRRLDKTEESEANE